MPELNWPAFEALPGAATTNWEVLCRELIRRNYERFGSFRSVTQQAGVEFDLKVDTACSLGDASKHWGWQCRWYGLPSGKQIGSARREGIIDAIQAAERLIPSLSDWVLWTRRPLTPTDQKWFYNISARSKLRLWHGEEVNGLLVGEAEVLRATYFGELVLTPERLKSLHEEATAPVRRRWEPQLHVEVEVERELRSALGMPNSWPTLRETADTVLQRAGTLESELGFLREDEAAVVVQLHHALQDQSLHLRSIADSLDGARIGDVRRQLENQNIPPFTRRQLSRLAARLRSVGNPASISVTGCASEIGQYFELLRKFEDRLHANLFAVTGDAGFGKTYLAAELTKATDDSPGGLLLHGKYLRANGTLDDLAKRLSFGSEGFDQLLEAVDAAGARMGRRLPIVIDGLNESEDPRVWKDLLSTLQVRLRRYDYCVVVVTLRSVASEDAIPTGLSTFSLTGFEYEPEAAVRKYFEFYKIDATDAVLPWDRFSSPLFLSLFCQATNPDRADHVGAESIPRSLVGVFDKYRDVVVSRIYDRLHLARWDIDAALERLGAALWDGNSRTIDFDYLRRIMGEKTADWENSLARAFEEEGVLGRERAWPRLGSETSQVSSFVYDAFAGFIAADAILSRTGFARLKEWLAENGRRLNISSVDRHPLAEDVLNALAGILSRKHYQQLWKLCPQQLHEAALCEAVVLSPESVDSETVAEVGVILRSTSPGRRWDLLRRLQSTRSIVGHPLNADFLHMTLSQMPVGERDLRWTEWLRLNRDSIAHELEDHCDSWAARRDRDEPDRLRARWISWILTSSVRFLRDKATKALYLFGLGSPQTILEMAGESLDLNDPYIPERLCAAAYGVLMGRQCEIDAVRDPAIRFLMCVSSKLLRTDATRPTNHWMTREYIQGVFAFAMAFFPDAVQLEIASLGGQLVFASAPGERATGTREQFGGHFGHDFEDDEVGQLFPDRSRYGGPHKRFDDAVTAIRERVWELGWRKREFEQIDTEILGSSYVTRREPSQTDSYALKYARIALQEAAGLKSGATRCKPRACDDEGLPVADIDPSFPEAPPQLMLELPTWTDSGPDENREWLESGVVILPEQLLRNERLNDLAGTWIAVDGFLKIYNRIRGRSAFAFLRGILVAESDERNVTSLLTSAATLRNGFIPEEPSDYYTFAGEIPWSVEFASGEPDNPALGLYKGQIGGYRGSGPVVETLSHQYSWEQYHSPENRAGGISVPSKSFSKRFALRSATSSFAFFEPNGELAAISLSAPANFEPGGSILYLRENLLRTYAKESGQVFLWIVWGERDLIPLGGTGPPWAQEIWQGGTNAWRRVSSLA
jgi:hypothetical protein